MADTRFKPGNRKNASGKTAAPRSDAQARLRKLAQKHGPEAIRLLVADMRDVKLDRSERRDAAAKLLDRGYGKPSQVVAGDQTAPLNVIIRGDDAKL